MTGTDCSDDLTIKIWATDHGGLQSDDGYAPWRHVCTLSGYHDRTIFSVHWSRDGVIASGAADDAIRLFVENQEDLVYFLHFIVVSLYQD